MTARQEYDAELSVLKEQFKMKMLTQDAYDKAQAALSEKYFPKPKKED